MTSVEKLIEELKKLPKEYPVSLCINKNGIDEWTCNKILDN